ncbi:uncharacterized protein B0J16DRAFT_319283 [Fusarium flagelliforme]|uniref:uncharacterized protein n=1 Tax=Fusarium flagelliforme TaxID=2675880 RepID=UPI001E8D60A0|nr:uncharacterized protein B0J16DRAFT_319283 [Fusarium flagelliforme]KAH7189657.1 hypothetical protein B0J16DRAFT_319283 [Fusarium flagelliforme]
MAKQEAENGDEIVRQINAGLAVREIDLSVQACTKIPTKKLESGKALALREQIVTEIFQQAGITQRQAPQVWERMAEAIMLRKMLKMTTLEQHERWKTVLSHAGHAIGLLRITNRHISLAPDDLGFIIAALLFRRLRPSGSPPTQVKNFIELFGTRNAMQWLSVAVAASKYQPKLRGPFIIEVDEGTKTPKFRYEQTLSKRNTSTLDKEGRLTISLEKHASTLIVTTRTPKVNIYEDDMLEAIRAMEPRFPHSEMQTKTPDLTNHNEESIEPGCDATQAELPAPAPGPASPRAWIHFG